MLSWWMASSDYCVMIYVYINAGSIGSVGWCLDILIMTSGICTFPAVNKFIMVTLDMIVLYLPVHV